MSETPKATQEPKRQISDEEFDKVMQELTGGKTAEEIQAEVKKGKWPFPTSEEQMRQEITLLRSKEALTSETTDKKQGA